MSNQCRCGIIVSRARFASPEMMTCHEVTGLYEVNDAGVLTLLSTFLQVLFLVLIVLIQLRDRRRVSKGEHGAATNLINPAYMWILVAYLISGIWLFAIALGIDTIDLNSGNPTSNEESGSIVAAFAWGFYHMILQGNVHLLSDWVRCLLSATATLKHDT
jgi:hypothetical protein